MYKTARIVAALALVPFFLTIPAHALSLKDWEAKAERDQLDYLRTCIAKLVLAVGQTDKPLAQKIYSYYSDKPPSLKYPEGTIDLFKAIEATEQGARTRGIDLSKIEIEDIVLRTTSLKFKLPDTAADAFKDSGAGTIKRKQPPAQPAVAPRPDLSAAPRPAASAGSPVMVGKIDVSHFASIKPADTPAQVVAIYGQPDENHGTYQFWANDGHGIFMVSYLDNVVEKVEAYNTEAVASFLRAHGQNDDLLNLFGQKDPAVVALLGPPFDQQDEDAYTYDLYWVFPMVGRPAPEYANSGGGQTLAVRFKRINPPTRQHGMRQDDADCIWVSVTW
jgi:hypothetical protein